MKWIALGSAAPPDFGGDGEDRLGVKPHHRRLSDFDAADDCLGLFDLERDDLLHDFVSF